MARNPKAEVEVTADSGRLNKGLRDARVKFSKFGAHLGSAGASFVGNLGASAVTSLGSIAVDQGKDVLAFNDALVRLQLAASSTPEEVAALGKVVRETSSEIGIGAREVLSGAETYVTLTGNFQAASDSARTFARVSQATSASVKDVATVAAAMNEQLGIRPDQFEEALSAVAAAGKAGSIELKNVSEELSTILPAWIEFGNAKGIAGNVESVRELSAVMQIVKKGTASASETTTNLRALMTSLVRNSDKLKASGVQVFNRDAKTGVKTLRPLMEIVDKIGESKLARNPDMLVKALGSTEALAAITQLRNHRGMLDDIAKAAGNTSVISKDLGTYLESSGGRTAVAFEKMKNSIAEAITPERIEQFTQAIEGAAQHTESLVEAMTAVGKGLGAIYDAGRSVRKFVDGGNAYKLTDSERETMDRVRRLQTRGVATPKDLASVGAINEKAAAYNRSISNITSAEKNDRPTDQSIRRAIVVAQSDMGQFQSTTPEGNAARAYLSDRQIGDSRYQRIKAEIDKESIEALRSMFTTVMKTFADKPTVVKADGKAIVDVHRNSSTHARRPGG